MANLSEWKKKLEKRVTLHTIISVTENGIPEWDGFSWSLRDSVKLILPVIYGVFVLAFGIFMIMIQKSYVSEKLSPNKFVDFFNIFLSVLGSALLIWMHMDISKHLSRLEIGPTNDEAQEDKELDSDIVFAEVEEDDYAISEHHHAGSNFLKIAAAFIGVGHVLHMGLVIAINVINLKWQQLQENEKLDCKPTVTIVSNASHIIFVALQVFVMFKYSDVIVNRKKVVARFAYTHCIVSSLLFWFSTLGQEVIYKLIKTHKCSDLTTSCTMGPKSWKGPAFKSNSTCMMSILCQCTKVSPITESLSSFTTYLYPFSIEFNILVVALWYVMLNNVGKVIEKKKPLMGLLPHQRGTTRLFGATHSNREIRINCQSAFTGLSSGLIFLAFVLVGIVIYMCVPKSQTGLSVDVYTSFRTFMLVCMIFASAMVFHRMSKFEAEKFSSLFMDDVLLIICLPAIFYFHFLIMLPIFVGEDVYSMAHILTTILMFIQVSVQTVAIVDGLRRRPNPKKDQVDQAGKNIVTFLIAANLGMWIWETLEPKVQGGAFKSQSDFYGQDHWLVLLNLITRPLSIYYWFHCAVALAGIWKSVYSPSQLADQKVVIEQDLKSKINRLKSC